MKAGGRVASAARASTHMARLKRAATVAMLRAGRPVRSEGDLGGHGWRHGGLTRVVRRVLSSSGVGRAMPLEALLISVTVLLTLLGTGVTAFAYL